MRRLAIGIDLGGTKLLGALVSEDGEVVASLRRPTPAAAGPAAVFAAMREAIETLLAQEGDRPLAGIGLGIPGPLDRERGVSVVSPNLGWREVPVLPEFAGYGVPVAMDNDVRCHTLGELHWGAGRGCTDFALLTLGTGIGSGLVLGGELYRGAGGMAGEIGHVTLEPDGPLCGCGKRGCLEVLASGPGIARRALDAGVAASSGELFSLAAAREARALALVEAIARDLGRGISLYVNLLNLERVVVGGGVAAAGELLLAPVRRHVEEETMPGLRGRCALVPAALGETAGAIGATALLPGWRAMR